MVQQINDQSGTITRIIGDRIVVGDSASIDADYRGKTLDGTLTAITTDFTSVNTLLAKKIEAEDINATTVQAAISSMNLLSVHQLAASSSIGCTGTISGSGLFVSGSEASWQSTEVITAWTISWYDYKRFATCDSSGNVTGSYWMQTIDTITPTKTTLHYLGY